MVKKVTIWSFLEPFLSTKEWIHLAEISKKLNIGHTTVRKNLNILEKKGILKKTHKGNLTLYKLNLMHPLLIDYIVLAEKELLLRKCESNVTLLELVNCMHELNNTLLLFGSTVVDINKAEDIDIITIGDFNKKTFDSIEKKINKKLHNINVSSLNEISQALKEEIYKKHLLINGTEEVVKWLLI